MTFGLIKLQLALAGWMMVCSGPSATSAGVLLGWRVDFVKDPAIPEVLRLHGCPAPKFRVINRHQIDLWEGVEQRLVGDGVRIARPIVILGFERLRFRRIEIVEVSLCEVSSLIRLSI